MQNPHGTPLSNPAFLPLSSQLVLDRRDFLESDAQQRKNVCIVDRVDEDKLRIRIAAAFKNCGVGAVGDMKKIESQSC